jgi:hypothetical protein
MSVALVTQSASNPAYTIPLSFDSGITEKEILVTIDNFVAKLYFNINTVEQNGSNLYMSCYTTDNSVVYFGSFRCVFGSYINTVDAGCPYKFFFLNNSPTNYQTITFDALNNGVNLYAVLR